MDSAMASIGCEGRIERAIREQARGESVARRTARYEQAAICLRTRATGRRPVIAWTAFDQRGARIRERQHRVRRPR